MKYLLMICTSEAVENAMPLTAIGNVTQALGAYSDTLVNRCAALNSVYPMMEVRPRWGI